MRLQILGYAIAAALLAAPAFGQSAPDASSTTSAAPAATSSAATGAQPYTAETTMIGDLLDDPAAKAVLEAHIPNVVNDARIDQARGMTLKAIQSYAPVDLSDVALAAIDTDFAKLPSK